MEEYKVAATREELARLLDRVEAATGPDRGVNADLYLLDTGYTRIDDDQDSTGTRSYAWRGDVFAGEITDKPRPAYTDSVDAALGLVQRALGKHWCWQVKSAIQHQCILWTLETDYDDRNPPTGYAVTAPLAIVSAFIRALAETTPAEGG